MPQLSEAILTEILQSPIFIITLSGIARDIYPNPETAIKLVFKGEKKTLDQTESINIEVNTYTQKQHSISHQTILPVQPDSMVGMDSISIPDDLITQLGKLLNSSTALTFTQAHIQIPTTDVYVRNLSNKMASEDFAKTKTKRTPPSKTFDVISTSNTQGKSSYPITFENSPELLKALDLCTNEGVIKPSRFAKYKQLNHFITLVSSLDVLKQERISIIDCGCGKSYLSLALYHWLKNIQNKEIHLLGIDTNQHCIDFSTQTANALGFSNTSFICAPIADEFIRAESIGKCDILIALHACDTATDDALALGVHLSAKAIVSAPCCHHYVNEQLRSKTVSESLAPLLRDGIVRERLADLLTDTMRRDLLRSVGYTAELIEFVSAEHTLKNIMLKAERSKDTSISMKHRAETISSYKALYSTWNVAPKLAELLTSELSES
jgi:hypothetical protein